MRGDEGLRLPDWVATCRITTAAAVAVAHNCCFKPLEPLKIHFRFFLLAWSSTEGKESSWIKRDSVVYTHIDTEYYGQRQLFVRSLFFPPLSSRYSTPNMSQSYTLRQTSRHTTIHTIYTILYAMRIKYVTVSLQYGKHHNVRKEYPVI